MKNYIFPIILGAIYTTYALEKDHFQITQLPQETIGEIFIHFIQSSPTYVDAFKRITTLRMLSKKMQSIENTHHQKIVNCIVQKHENQDVHSLLTDIQTPEQANTVLLNCSLVFEFKNEKYDFLHHYNTNTKKVLDMHKFVIKILRERGANLDKKNYLHHDEIIKAPGNEAVTTTIGASPLFCSIIANQTTEFIQALLIHGADPDTPNNDGQTPLMIARSKGSDEIVTILLQHNANEHAVDNSGNTVFDEKYNIFAWSIEPKHLKQMIRDSKKS